MSTAPAIERARLVIFFLILALFMTYPAMAIYNVPNADSIGEIETDAFIINLFSILLAAVPLIFSDASYFSEIAPIIGAGLLSAAAPISGSVRIIVASFIICLLGYFLYLIFSITIDGGLFKIPDGRGGNISVIYSLLQTHISYPISENGPQNAHDAQKVLLQFSEKMRLFYGIVGAALIGAKLRGKPNA